MMKFVVSILLLAIVMASCLMALSVSAAASTQPNLDQGRGSLAVSHVDAAAYRLRADAGEGSAVVSPTDPIESDGSIKNSDGINTVAAGIWISVVSGILFCAILTFVIVLAKKNSGK